MSTTFPRTRKSVRGYDVDQVEDFLEDARKAYTADRAEERIVTADSIRQVAFAMQKGGYSPSHVDAALERLEDAFAAREKQRVISLAGDTEWFARARTAAQEIIDRLSRPRAQRFNRVGLMTTGYDVKEVDQFADRLNNYFQKGKPLAIDDVRTVAFRGSKRGYSETQVDLVLDAVIDVMLAVR